MHDSEVENKIKYILLEISRNKKDEKYLIEILNHSIFIFESHWNKKSFQMLIILSCI